MALTDFLDPLRHKLIHADLGSVSVGAADITPGAFVAGVTIPAGQVTGLLVESQITSLPASKVTTGTFAAGSFIFPSNLDINGQLRAKGNRHYFWDGIELAQPASTPYIDFHRSSNPEEATDYNVRLINDSAGWLTLIGSLYTTGSMEVASGSLKISGTTIDFPDTVLDNKIDLFGGTYLIGVRSSELFLKSAGGKLGFEAPSGIWGMRYGPTETYASTLGLWVNGRVQATAGMYASDWFRSVGNTGWYSQDYGGGWFMQDTTWIRVLNNKHVYSGSGMIRSDNRLVASAEGGSTGVYLWNDSNTDHRLFMIGSSGPRLAGWVMAQLASNAYDVMAEAGWNSSSVRHVNLPSNAWRDSEAATHWDRSDPQEKKDIVPMAKGQLEKVKQIKPIKFKDKNAGKPNYDPAEREHLGFNANELPPEAIKISYLKQEDGETPRETLMVNPTAMLAVLWQAVLELTEKVEVLEEEKK